ncbi:MAG: aldo/keto reductase [Dehalococcoidales bacterium]
MKTSPNSEIPRRTLGRTGEKVSAIGLGGFHIGGRMSENESIQIIRYAIDNGITFMDNCWDYNEGASEIRMGKALKDGYRNKVFLMTKIDAHTARAATRQLEESLQRLQTDTIDLLQFHEVIRITDPEKIFSPGGSMETVVAAKKAGKLRYIGFTGHKSPDIHLKMLQTARENDFRFDTVQMPLNVMDAHYDSFEKKVLPVTLKENIGVLAMKPMGAGMFLKSNTVTPAECLHYTMSLPVSVVITGFPTMAILQETLESARSYVPMTEEKCAAILAKTALAAADGKFERYKTEDVHDGTIHNPQFLGED